MTAATCPRCHLQLAAPHDDPAACIGALGAALAELRAAVGELNADLAERRAQEQRARELHEQAEADMARGG